MLKVLYNHRLLTVFSIDILMVISAWIGSLFLYFDLHPPVMLFTHFLPYLILIQGTSFYFFGLHRGTWRYASFADLILILKTVMTGVIIFFVIFRLENNFLSLFSISIIYGMLLILFLSAPRFIYRGLKQYQRNNETCTRVLITGAGSAGESLVRDLTRLRAKGYRPVAFVDDDPQKMGREIHGIRIRGACKDIPNLTKKLNIQLNLIAIPSATPSEMQRITSYCELAQLPFRALPSLREITEGRINIKQFAEVSLEQLLGREEVNFTAENIKALIQDKIIAVSGGGGSIGSELCTQLAALNPKALIIIDNCEFNLYNIDLKLREIFPHLCLYTKLCSVTDKYAINHIFATHQPELIFHAAAYKHVPLLESHIRIATFNNIVGSRILAEAAAANRCKIFVLISTDKAVNPTNIMGATKRASEIFCQNFNDHTNTRFITVRFGNVLDSAGSVVPLFRKQLNSGGPLTVTHPEITRFFMTIPEASQLIIQAASMGQGGEIFVLDMGAPIKISYLARKLIQLSGKILGKDICIEYTGLRPGEKLHEELFYGEEELIPTSHVKIRKASSQKRAWALLLKLLNELEQAYEMDDEEKMLELLHLIVPEYHIVTYKQNPSTLNLNYSQ